MGKIKAYRNVVSAFIASDKGQRFFNFAYSIGAAVVIWGALFKILHLPGGNTLLSLGMGTEVLMFLLTAFDRPPREYDWEKVYPQLGDEEAEAVEHYAPVPARAHHKVSEAEARRAAGIPAGIDLSESDSRSLSESIAKLAGAADQLSRMAELTSATQQYLDGIGAIADDMKQLHATTAALNEVSTVLLDSYRAITDNSEAISRSSEGYVNQMTELHRNISGLNTIYELQLRGVSSQIDSIERVNRGIKDIRDMYEKSAMQSARYCEETERMARYMQQLNSVYEKMLTAMTVNMYRPGMTPPGIDIDAKKNHTNGKAMAPEHKAEHANA